MLHTQTAILVLHIFGFEVNMEKSSLVPSRQAEYIGFIFDGLNMTVCLPADKVTNVASLCAGNLVRDCCSADELKSLIGRLESVKPVVSTAALQYCSLQLLLRPLHQDWICFGGYA